jgi:restriction endonuclease S subunit
MNNLEQLSERLEKLQSDLVTLKVDLSDAINSAKEEQNKPLGKYELSDLMKETIVQLLDRFIDKNVFDELDTSHQQNVYGGGIDIDVTFDLQDIVSDQIASSHRLANDFVDELIRELDNLKEQEEDEATEFGEQQHQDC